MVINSAAVAQNRLSLSTMFLFDFPASDNTSGVKSYGSVHRVTQFMPKLDLDLIPQASLRIEGIFSEEPVSMRSAYLQWAPSSEGPAVWLGQRMVPFSHQHMIPEEERRSGRDLFTAGDGYGNPGYQPGISSDYWYRQGWRARGFIGRANVTTDGGSELRFVSPWQIDSEAGLRGESGDLYSLRGEYHYGDPRGYYRDRSGDDRVATAAVALFDWHPDYVNSSDPLRGVQGIELDLAVRWLKYTAVLSFNRIDATMVNASAATGFFGGGRAGIDQNSLQVGYLLWPGRLEPMVSYSQLKNSSWSSPWVRSEMVWNIYVNGLKSRFQFMLGGESNRGGRGLGERYLGVRVIYTLD